MSTTKKTEIPVTTGTTATTGTGLGAAPLVTPVPPVTVPVVGMQGLSVADRVVHEPEQIIRHEPIVETEILREPALEVKREHHIQPIIHETEHRIQPIIKTEATTERPIIVQDRDVMMEPVLERAALPAGLEAVERVAPEGIIHMPRVAKDVVVEHPVEIRHERHIQPVIHEREHRIQPIVKTEVTTEETHLRTEHNVMLEPVLERAALPVGLEPVERAGPEGVVHRPIMEKEVLVEHPVQVKHERHIQPIIHEREHRIQPIIKTEVTTEQVIVNEEHNVMLPPIIEPPVVVDRGLPPVLPAAFPAVVATTTLPHSVGLTDPSQPLPQAPVIHRGVAPLNVAPGPGVLDTEQGLTGAGGAPLAADRAVPVVVAPAVVPGAVGTTGATTGAATHKPTMGQRFKGAVKQLEGSIIGDQVKREEGKLISEGVDPATAHATAVSESTTGTLL